jgi:hypothetical protein
MVKQGREWQVGLENHAFTNKQIASQQQQTTAQHTTPALNQSNQLVLLTWEAP